jgi:diaminohydroxyphosphoribosylaminopyrimidine deaminase/5-amino-6-(5-phosphoribosylamino)uracil reductase
MAGLSRRNSGPDGIVRMEEEWQQYWCFRIIPPEIYWDYFMAEETAEKFMQLALRLAEKGKGLTSPNPMVGAVVVKEGRIIGRGYHKRAGMPHAEIMALREAKKAARGATLYVNLEPCCHYGRTDPCTDAIIKAGIREVVYAIKDPNPKVNGKGAAALKKAGLKVSGGLYQMQAARLNEAYTKYIATGRPFVILKTAQSLDGRIATLTGDSKWISGLDGRQFAHRLRAEADAVMVGAGTVRADNPRLTVRLAKGRNPYRIVLSRHADFPGSINLFKHNKDAKTILATSEKSAGQIKVKNLIVWSIKEDRFGLSLDDLLEKAGRFGITSLLVEGGGRLATSLIRKDLVDKQYLLIAPFIIGRGTDGVGELNIRKLTRAVRFGEWVFKPCGTDILFTGYPARK